MTDDAYTVSDSNDENIAVNADDENNDKKPKVDWFNPEAFVQAVFLVLDCIFN